MAEGNWGHCSKCRYFDNPSQTPVGDDEGNCVQPELRAFELLVMGGSGCNRNQPRAERAPVVEAPQPSP